MPDQIKIEILSDGKISVDTGQISGPNHVSADEFLAEIEKAAGGSRVTQDKPEKYAHQHTHETAKQW